MAGFTPSSSPLALQVEQPLKLPPEPTPPAVVNADLQSDKTTPAEPASNLAEVTITNAPIVREVIPQTRQSRIPNLQTSQANATETVGLSERFGKGAVSQTNQPIAAMLHDAKADRQAQGQSRQLASVPKDELRLQVSPPAKPAKKRDKQRVEQVVLHANAGATLDNSQVKILVARLAKGDCLSSALHGIFGENKISPVFVRTLLTDMENRC